MTLKVVVTGAMGRMGNAILKYVNAEDEMEIYGATERHDHPDIAKDVGGLVLGRNIDLGLENDLRNTLVGADAIIDFTWPEASLWHLDIAVEFQIPIIIGTTGFTPEQMEQLKTKGEKTRTVWSPNMSVCVNLLWKMAAQTATVLGDEYDVEIVETHHRKKLDAPSGTAKKLAETIAQAWEKQADDIMDHGRVGNVGERQYGRIGMHALRGGDIVGEHTARFFGPGEELFIGHRATSRDNFVQGAIRAALFLQNVEKGFYSMWDVLKL